MHFSLFLLLGFTISASAQLVDLPAEDPSTASTNNAEIGFDSTGDGVGGYDFRSDSLEAPLIMSQKDDNQLCSSNGNNQRPPKRRLRARDWCRKDQYELGPETPPATDIKPPPSSFQDGEPKKGSAGGGNSGQAGAGQDRRIGKSRTRKPLELPPIPGRTPSFQEEAHDPCSEERTYAVCSPLEPTTYWFPLSLIWATGSLEYCRLYHPNIPCKKEAGEKLYCCRELQNMYPSRQGTPRAMLQFRAQYQKLGKDCERPR